MNTRKANSYFLGILILLILAQFFMPFGLGFLNIPQKYWIFFLEFSILFIPTVLYLIISKKPIKETLRLKPLNLKSIGIIIVIAILSQPLMTFLSVFSQLFFHNDVADAVMQMSSMPYFILLAIVAITPAICEEMVLRGVVLSGYKNVPIMKVALMNGFLFAVFHLGPQQFLYAFALGMVFVYLVEITGSIWASALCHFLINSFSANITWISARFLKNQTEQSVEFSSLPPAVIVIILLFLFVLAAGFTVLLVMVIKELAKVNNYSLRNREEQIKKLQSSEKQDKILTWHIYAIGVLYLAFVIFVAIIS